MKNKPIYRCRVNKRWRSTAYGLICFWVIKDLFVHQMQSLNILIKEIIAAFLIHLDWRYSTFRWICLIRWSTQCASSFINSAISYYIYRTKSFADNILLHCASFIFFLQNYSQARNLAEKIQNFVDKLFALICGPKLKSDVIKYYLLKSFLILLLFGDLLHSILLIF